MQEQAEGGSGRTGGRGGSRGPGRPEARRAVDDVVARSAQVGARGAERVRERVDRLPAVGAWGEVVEGVVEEARERGAAAALALAGRRPPRRWPWAVGAAVAGAAAGAGVALLLRRMVGEDAPGAQEPEQLRAVVDLRPAGPS